MNRSEASKTFTLEQATWYHGTDAKPFSHWILPAPNLSPADVAHSCLFFTDLAFAQTIGQNTCSVNVSSQAQIIAPAVNNEESRAFRLAVRNKHPLARHVVWLESDLVWANAWNTGEVMRYAFNQANIPACLEIQTALNQVQNDLKKMLRGSTVSDQILSSHAMQCLTRGWIETIITAARDLGFQGIYGAEIDRHSGAKPISRPWLAILDTTVVSPPSWL